MKKKKKNYGTVIKIQKTGYEAQNTRCKIVVSLTTILCVIPSLRCFHFSVHTNKQTASRTWSSRIGNQQNVRTSHTNAARQVYSFSCSKRRTKMASEREEESVSERTDDWGKSDRDGKWVSSVESSLVIDPCRQTARCYIASPHKM
jgi:hypothetical protein